VFAWAERERGRESWVEGANERGEVGEQEAGLKRGTGARMWPENVWSWARPRRGDRGRQVEDELTGGDGRIERGNGRARGKRSRQAWPTGQREVQRSERAGWRRQAGPACQTQGARMHGLGLLGWLGLKWPFPFSWNFYCLFYLFSLGFSIQVSNSNQIKYVQQFKEYLGSI
jgi:hypothetical protein